MKPKEKDQLEQLYAEYYYLCFCCSNLSTQRAHIIGNTKVNRRIYGPEIIDNPLNWLPVCSLEHNALVDIGHASLLSDAIAESIKEGDRPAIEQLVKNNIVRKKAK